LVFDIVDEEYSGRKVFERLNIINDNETAQRIGKQKLSAICLILGITKKIDNTEELHDKPMVVVLGIKPASDKYGESNEIKGYKRIDGASVKDILKEQESGVKAAPAGKMAPAGPKKKPWHK